MTLIKVLILFRNYPILLFKDFWDFLVGISNSMLILFFNDFYSLSGPPDPDVHVAF